MLTLIHAFAVRLALAPALFGAGRLIARRFGAPRGVFAAGVRTGIVSLLLVMAAPVSLHFLGLPVSPESLALWHWTGFLVIFSVTRERAKPRETGCRRGEAYRLGAAALVLAGLVFPYTHMAGIDTYRWHAVASMVGESGRIAWLAHPLGLAGFTPYAYPAGQPLLLATILLLGGLGVDASWYLCSLFIGLLALFSMARLGQRFFGSDRWAVAAAFFYVFSPLFMRYGHWATGRGLFLALMPLLLAAVLCERPRRAWAGWLAVGLLLSMSHKTALAAVPLMAGVRLGAGLTPRRPNLATAALLSGLAALPALGALLLWNPDWRALLNAGARLGWPAAAVPLAFPAIAGQSAEPRDRRLLLAVGVTFPLVFMRDMYGALIALAPATLLATAGLRCLWTRIPEHRRTLTATCLALLTLCGALAVIVKRSREAMPPAVRAAAAFIDRHDPGGPFRIEAPGRARGQIRAYTRGSRSLARYGPAAGSVRTAWTDRRLPGPALKQPEEWIVMLRHLLAVDFPEFAWHDPAWRVYHVRVGGEGRVPPDALQLYDRDGVAVFVPAGRDGKRKP